MKTKPLQELLDRHFTPGEQKEAEAEARVIILESRLHELRESFGLSQRELAKLLEVKQPQIHKWESAGDMMVSSLLKFVEGLGCRLRIQAETPNHPNAWVTLTDFEPNDDDKEQAPA